jgi:hypothetical protein
MLFAAAIYLPLYLPLDLTTSSSFVGCLIYGLLRHREISLTLFSAFEKHLSFPSQGYTRPSQVRHPKSLAALLCGTLENQLDIYLNKHSRGQLCHFRFRFGGEQLHFFA